MCVGHLPSVVSSGLTWRSRAAPLAHYLYCFQPHSATDKLYSTLNVLLEQAACESSKKFRLSATVSSAFGSASLLETEFYHLDSAGSHCPTFCCAPRTTSRKRCGPNGLRHSGGPRHSSPAPLCSSRRSRHDKALFLWLAQWQRTRDGYTPRVSLGRLALTGSEGKEDRANEAVCNEKNPKAGKTP